MTVVVTRSPVDELLDATRVALAELRIAAAEHAASAHTFIDEARDRLDHPPETTP